MIKFYPQFQNYAKTTIVATLMGMMPMKATTAKYFTGPRITPYTTDVAEFSLHTIKNNVHSYKLNTQDKKAKPTHNRVPQPSVNIDVSKTKFEGDPQFLNQFLNGVLKGKGRAFYKAQNKYGINATFLIGIANHESGNGTSEVARKYNNVGGMKSKKGYIKYPSVEVCIDSIASNLKRNYIDKGLKTPVQISKKYCKDPLWPKKIVSHMKEVYEGTRKK